MTVSADEMREIIPLEKTPHVKDYEQKGSLGGVVKRYIEDWESVQDEGVDFDRIEHLWQETDLDPIQVQDAFQALKEHGEIYELETEVYRVT